MTKSAIDVAKARWVEAEAVADAFRDQLAKRQAVVDYHAGNRAAAIGGVNDALAQLAAAKRAANQAHTLYRSLDQRKTR